MILSKLSIVKIKFNNNGPSRDPVHQVKLMKLNYKKNIPDPLNFKIPLINHCEIIRLISELWTSRKYPHLLRKNSFPAMYPFSPSLFRLALRYYRTGWMPIRFYAVTGEALHRKTFQ